MAAYSDVISVKQHYSRGSLGETILEALRSAGKKPDSATPKDLAPVDQFHTGRWMATLELARAAGFDRDMHILDSCQRATKGQDRDVGNGKPVHLCGRPSVQA
jgi:hypothetical protein